MLNKKCLMCLMILFFVVNLLAPKADAIILGIRGDDLAEAVEYGKKNKKTKLSDFTKAWTVSLGNNVGWATLYTGFHNVAYKSRKAAIEHKELINIGINQALEISKVLTFTVSIFGNSMDFAQEYHAMIEIDKSFVPPDYEFIPEYAEPSEFWPESPDYVAGCVFKFPVNSIKEDSVVKLILKPFDGEVLQFTFDLSKMK